MNIYESSQVLIALNAVLAFAFGSIIGYTRLRSNRPAGIRTQALICSGAALMSSLSISLGTNFGATNADPARIMAQIVTGIGFLGGGVIVKNNDRLKGITTAAMIWFTAGVGMLLGAGYYIPAFVALFLIILVEIIAKLEFKYGLKTKPYLLTLYKKDLKKISGIIKLLPGNFQLNHVNSHKFSFCFYSSKQKNTKIIAFLKEKQVVFTLNRQSSLKASLDSFNEYV